MVTTRRPLGADQCSFESTLSLEVDNEVNNASNLRSLLRELNESVAIIPWNLFSFPGCSMSFESAIHRGRPMRGAGPIARTTAAGTERATPKSFAASDLSTLSADITT